MKITPVKDKVTGDRFLIVDGGVIPIGIASMCVDRRISGFKIKCTECREFYPVRDLNDGGYCEACVFAGFEEGEE